MEYYNKENEINNSLSRKNLDSINSISQLNDITKSICRIDLKFRIGYGFLIKLEKGTEPFYCLMTGDHILKAKSLKNEVIVYYNYGKSFFRIKIKEAKDTNKNQRYLKSYSFINLGVFVLGILPEDNIEDYFFIKLNYIFDLTKILKEKLYIIQFPQNGRKNISEGKIISINQYEFIFNSNTKNILSGCPIFVIINNILTIIGLYKKKKEDMNYYGYFINVPIESLKKNLNFHKIDYDNGTYIGEYKGNVCEGYGKFIRDNDSYYIGQWLNDAEHGKGTIYLDIHSKNNEIIYEGDFAYGKPNGYGKCYYENGNYYIGEFSNGIRNGKGTIYYKNDCIKYEGDFVDDKVQGNGKYIWENGDYYIGQFVNDSRHGKGIEYYKNGNKEYEGDFVDNKYEGFGTFYWKNGEYYVGGWIHGLKHGKGKIYSKDKTLIYEGDFVEGQKSCSNII